MDTEDTMDTTYAVNIVGSMGFGEYWIRSEIRTPQEQVYMDTVYVVVFTH